MITIAAIRRASGEMPSARTRAVSDSVKAVKLATKPASTPSGRALPPPTLPDSTMGRTGRMHGESTVTSPDRKAKARSTAMDRSSRRPAQTFTVFFTMSWTPPPFQAASLVPLESICTKVCWEVTP